MEAEMKSVSSPFQIAGLFVRPAVWILAAMVSFLAPSAFAQTGGDPLDRPEYRKFWNPVVGKGALYESTEKDSGRKAKNLEIQVVGKENVEGKEAYWIEFGIDNPELGGISYGKSLYVFGEMRPRRMIIQYAGMDPMEMPLHPNSSSKAKVQDLHLRKVGTETITVPAGTFACEHWKNDNSDFWVSTKVSPFSLVKDVSKNSTEILVKIFDNAKDHVTGPVKPYDPKALMQHMMELKKKQ
jgi:hypothetical protein